MDRTGLPSLPTVSVVVSTWQQGQFLASCLESLVAQDYPALEIAVYDNMSTDETASVLERFAPRLTRVVRERDGGQASALRRGFAGATGDIFAWLNADDVWMPGAVSAVVAAFERAPRPDVVYGHCTLLDEGGSFLGYFDDIAPFSAHELWNYSDFIPQPSTFFRRSVYEAAGGLDARLNWTMDWDLWCRMARAQARFAQIDAVLSGARLHPRAKTARGGWRRVLELTRVNMRHKTLPIPMLVVLYLAYLCAPCLGSERTASRRALRRLWRRATGRDGTHKSVVRGFRHGTRIGSDRFCVELPVWGRLSGASVGIGGGAESKVAELRMTTGEGIELECAGESRNRLVWSAQPSLWVERLVVRGALRGTPGADATVEVELVRPVETVAAELAAA